LKAKIKELLIKGTSLRNISKKIGMPIKDVNNIIFEIWKTPKEVEDINKVIYSSSEEYLMNGDKTTYDDLSPSEQRIYNNLN
jgi:hypothetical protein